MIDYQGMRRGLAYTSPASLRPSSAPPASILATTQHPQGPYRRRLPFAVNRRLRRPWAPATLSAVGVEHTPNTPRRPLYTTSPPPTPPSTTPSQLLNQPRTPTPQPSPHKLSTVENFPHREKSLPPQPRCP